MLFKGKIIFLDAEVIILPDKVIPPLVFRQVLLLHFTTNIFYMKNFAMQKNLKITTVLTFVIMFLCLSTKGFAQENIVFDYKSLLTKTQDTKRKNDLAKMQSLATDLLPSISIVEGKVQQFGDSDAISIETDAKSFSEIKNLKGLTAKVEILKIKLNSSSDLSSKFDLESLKNIESLEYVYIICPFEATASQVSNLLSGTNNNVTVIYTASLPR